MRESSVIALEVGSVLGSTYAFQGRPVPCKILLGGDLNSGKSTLRQKLAELIGFEAIYTGAVMREMANEAGIDILEFYKRIDPIIEMGIDERQIQKTLRTPNIIFEGRIAAWIEEVAFSLDIDLGDWESFIKIRLFLAVDLKEGVRRALNRPENSHKNIEELERETLARIEEEKHRYRNLYGIINHMDKSQFDIVIDTTRLTSEEVLKETYSRIANYLRERFFRE